MRSALELIELCFAIENLVDDWKGIMEENRDDAEVIDQILGRSEYPNEAIVKSLDELKVAFGTIIPAVKLAEDYLTDSISNSTYLKRLNIVQEASKKRLEDDAVSTIGPEVNHLLKKLKN